MQTTSVQTSTLTVEGTNEVIARNSWLMLFSRSALFLFFQTLIALLVLATGKTYLANAWDESARWWTFLAFLANFVSIYLLVRLFKVEGKDYFQFLRFSRVTWKADLLWFVGFSIVGVPFAAMLRDPLGAALFGDAMTRPRTRCSVHCQPGHSF